ncbi:MAG: outer membrane beta-barrel protein [Thermoanaerobaculia bacterium]
MRIRKTLFFAWIAVAAAAALPAQSFGVGAAVGLVNDISGTATLDGFKHSEVNGWVDYKMEESTLLRLTYGSMRTTQTNSGSVVTTPDGPAMIPLIKERVDYGTVGVSYLFWEGFFTSGVFAGIGGYGIRPDAVPADIEPHADRDETVFGWHAGLDGDFRLIKHLSLVLRFTYHNVSAHPHRQWVTANTGLMAKF